MITACSPVEQFTCKRKPSLEDAAHLIRDKLVPVAAELDLNDLEGRKPEPTVKILKDQNSIQILDISARRLNIPCLPFKRLWWR